MSLCPLSRSMMTLFLAITSIHSLSQSFSEVNIGAIPKNLDSHALWADIDNDADQDLILSYGSDGSVLIYKNSGGTMSFYSAANMPTLLHPILGAADFNKDGFVDLVLSGVVGDDVSSVMGGGIYINDGTGVFSKSITDFVALARGSVDCADFDLDGDADILMTGYNKNLQERTIVMMNNNDGSFTELPHQLPGVSGYYRSSGTWGDFDRDGDPDILLSGLKNIHHNEGLTKIYVNNGDRTFSESTVFLEQNDGKSEWVDVNNDGALDIFAFTPFPQLYINQSGNFVKSPSPDNTHIFSDFHWVDFDNDGDKDLVATEAGSGIVSVYINNAGTSFTRLSTFSVPNHTEVSVVDFDSDGHCDIFLSGFTYNNGVIASNLALKNLSTTSNQTPNSPTNLTANISGREVQFAWDAATDAENSSSSLEYVLRVGTSSGSSNVVSSMTSEAGDNRAFEFLDSYQTTTRSVNNLSNGTYYATVQAVDKSEKVSVSSNEIIFTVTGASDASIAPSNLRLTLTTTNFVELKWLDQSNSENTFDIERSDDGVSFQPLTSVSKNNMSYVDKTVELGKTYYYKIKAVNATASSNYTTAQSILNPIGKFRKLEGFELNATEIIPSVCVNWVDYNSDGFDDLFMASDGGSNFLYQNKGDGSFLKITSGNLTNPVEVQNRNSVWADYDNDGDMDVFIPTSSKGILFRNDGGSFIEITASPFNELTPDLGGASWIDYDNDGFLDLSVLYYNSPSNLFHNNKNGTFSKVIDGSFVKDAGNFSHISWCDYNNDGWQDALALDYSGKLILYNNRKGMLEKVVNVMTPAGYPITSSWADYDNDGDFDVFIGSDAYASDAFFKNNGNGSFTWVPSSINKVFNPTNGSSFGDIDNDGDIDLFLTGESKRIFLNSGDGSFEMQSPEPATSDVNYANAVALGDYNKDGFLDAAYSQSFDGPVVLKNNGNNNHWISFRLTGTTTNRNAIGVKATIIAGGKKRTNYIASQTGQLAENSFNLHFGLGSSTIIDSLIIEWPLHGFQNFTNVPADQFMAITEPNFPPAPTLTNVTYNYLTQRVSASWGTTPDATRYILQRSISNQDGFYTVAIVKTPFFEEDMPIEFDSVFYRVIAVTGNNTSSWYSNIQNTFCGLRAPDNLEADRQNNSVLLKWNDLSTHELQYEIFRSSTGTAFDKITTVANNVTQYNDLNFEEQTTHNYALQAVNGKIRSRYSDTTSVVITTLRAPTDVSLALNSNKLLLHWTDNSKKETSYVIERSYGNNEKFEIVGTTGENSVNFFDENFNLNQLIFYRIQAINSNAKSEYSNEVNILVTALEAEVDDLVSVYPNPATAVVNVKAPEGEKMFSITNTIGVEVISSKSQTEFTQFNINHLPSGLYILNAVISGKNVMKRISVINR